MDTIDSDRDRREMIRRDREADRRKAMLADAEHSICQRLDGVLADAEDFYGFYRDEVLDLISDWLQKKEKER